MWQKRTVRDGAHRSSAFLREGMKLPKRPRALHKNRRRANLHGRLYRQPYRRPGVRAGCWHRPGRRRRGWRPPCYPGQGAALAAASPVLVLVLIAGMVGAFLASPFGVFFSNETTQDGMLMRQATAELNEEYYARIGQIEQANPHDILEIEASDGVSAIRWEDVLSVYAVKVTTDGVNGMDVVTMDEQKKRDFARCDVGYEPDHVQKRYGEKRGGGGYRG